jgi:hypothetical protein
MPDFDIVLKDHKGEERSILINAKTKEEAHRLAKQQNPSEKVLIQLTKKF